MDKHHATTQEFPDENYDIFISYSTKNVKSALCIQEELKQQGLKCFLAYRTRDDIPSGKHWVKELVRALKNSKIVLLIFSKESDTSEQVQNEIGLAARYKLDILPLRIQEEEPGEVLEYYLIHKQRFDVIPEPPPFDDEVQKTRLINSIRRLLEGEKLIFHTQSKPKIPFLSIGVLQPLMGRVRKIYESMSPLKGALFAYLIMFLVYFIPLAVSHRMVGTYLPRSLYAVFEAASGYHFYYPDLNAILFDIVLHPAAFATLIYFNILINQTDSQYLFSANAWFVSTQTPLKTKRFFYLINLFLVRCLPLLMAVICFFYRRAVYLGYSMKEPLVLWASLAVGLSVYVMVALAIKASYIALLVKPLASYETLEDDEKIFGSEQTKALARLIIIFSYIVLMCLIEIVVQWMMSDFNGVKFLDLIRWVTLIFGGVVVLIPGKRIIEFLFSDNGYQSKALLKAFKQVEWRTWSLLILPVLLIILTIKLGFQVY